ncbi:MAG TPA: hypothetical protein VGA53_02530 [Candidatus Paceibacterota bacterium]
MDLQEIKEIIQKEGGKIVIVENDRPQLIIMSFEEYKGKIQVGQRSSPVVNPVSPSAPKAEQGEPRVNPYSPPMSEGDQAEGLTIDDLPL